MKSEIFSCVKMLLEHNSPLVSLKDSGTYFFAHFTVSMVLILLFLKVLANLNDVKKLSVVTFLPIL